MVGRLHVEVMRVTGAVPERVMEGDDSSENSSESGSLEIMDNNGEIIHRPKKFTCRVRAASSMFRCFLGIGVFKKYNLVITQLRIL